MSEINNIRPPWKRGKWLAAMATIVTCGALLLFGDLDPTTASIVAGAIPMAISLYQHAEGRSDVARARTPDA